jgi:hypothetical protein
MCSSVDLPQPEGPRMVTNSPGRMPRSIASSARVPLSKTLVACATATASLCRVAPAGSRAFRAGP